MNARDPAQTTSPEKVFLAHLQGHRIRQASIAVSMVATYKAANIPMLPKPIKKFTESYPIHSKFSEYDHTSVKPTSKYSNGGK